MVEEAGRLGLPIEVSEFPEGTKTAADAAAAIGCEVSAIVKSLVFTVDGSPVVALVAGDRRLDPRKLAEASGGTTVERASLALCREATGFAAGGTPPFGFSQPLPVWADRSLLRNERVWAAAGTPTTVFGVDVNLLVERSGAVWAELS